MSRAGLSQRKGRCSQEWLDITYGFFRNGQTIQPLRKIRTRESSPLRTARPARRASFQPKKSWMRVFWNSCGYGIRRPDDPIIVDSLKVVDAVLKVETPFGPCWHRYNHDGYGQREDGGPFVGWGQGRAWPLLTGERGHYELAAGHDTKPFIRAMEGFASATGLLPEQVWDGRDQPQGYMYCGRPTGSAMPLMWAHAEYIKLLRSVRDGKVSDLIAEVAKRYLRARCGPSIVRSLEVYPAGAQRQTRLCASHPSSGFFPAALVGRRMADREGYSLIHHHVGS